MTQPAVTFQIHQLEDHFANSAELSKMIKQIEDELRTQYQAAGIKLVR